MSEPYTPASIKQMRDMARSRADVDIAQALGWDVATVRSRARTHGIDLRIAPPAPPVRSPSVDRRSSGSLSPVDRDGIRWDPGQRQLSRYSGTVTLPLVEAAVFNILFKVWLRGDDIRLTRAGISERLGVIVNGNTILRLRQRIAPLHIAILATKGGPGYWLSVDAMSDAAAEAAE